MKKNNTSDVLHVVESLRQSEYSHVPAELVEEIIRLEEQHVENRSQILRHLDTLIEDYVQQWDGNDAEA